MMPKLSTMARDWVGATAVVIGNGPSLFEAASTLGLLAALTAAGRAKTLVANGGYKLVPKASVLMCSDRHWLAANPDLSGYLGPEVIVTQPQAVVKQDLRMRFFNRAFIENVRGDIFKDPSILVEGHNSTSTNISVAVLRGAARIILLGVDLAPGPNMRRRTYDESVDDPRKAAARYDRQVRHLGMQSDFVRARGVEVFNASPKSALACYPYAEFGALFQ